MKRDQKIKKSGSGEYGGISYQFKYFPGGQNAPPSYTIQIPCRSCGAFKITKETRFDRFFEKIGICIEHKTGDPDFDNTYYINSDHVEFTRLFFGDTEKRKRINDLFQAGFNRIEHNGKEIKTVMIPCKRGFFMTEDQMHGVVMLLSDLTRNMPELPESGGLSQQNAWKEKRILAFVLPSLFFLTGIAAIITGMFRYKPLDFWAAAGASLRWSIPALLLFLILALSWIRGRSNSHRELIIIIIISLQAFPVGGAGMQIFLNGYLDKTPAVAHEVTLLRKKISKSKNSTDYHAIVSSWRPGHTAESIDVPGSLYQKLIPGETTMSVTTKPGRFGHEWIVNYRIVKPDSG